MGTRRVVDDDDNDDNGDDNNNNIIIIIDGDDDKEHIKCTCFIRKVYELIIRVLLFLNKPLKMMYSPGT